MLTPNEAGYAYIAMGPLELCKTMCVFSIRYTVCAVIFANREFSKKICVRYIVGVPSTPFHMVPRRIILRLQIAFTLVKKSISMIYVL